MFTVLGWLLCGIIMLWVSVVVYFATVSTFSEALFDGKWYHKIIGVLLWVVCAYLWYSWLGAIEINV